MRLKVVEPWILNVSASAGGCNTANKLSARTDFAVSRTSAGHIAAAPKTAGKLAKVIPSGYRIRISFYRFAPRP
jgi:hypothetical protein